MSETNATTAVETPIAANKASKPNAARKPANKKAGSKKAASNGHASLVSGSQYRILKALVAPKGGSLTRKQLMDRAFGGNSVNMKPLLEPMIAKKLIKPDTAAQDGGREETVFFATAAGKKVASGPAPQRATKVEHQPLPKVGGTFTKNYKGKDYNVKVLADGFQVGSKKYTSLTAAAKGIRGSEQEVNGWAFFGLTK